MIASPNYTIPGCLLRSASFRLMAYMADAKAADRVIGKLIGNTGDPMKLKVALKDSFSARRGEFVRVLHQEDRTQEPLPVLGRIVAISRSSVLFSEAVSEGLADLTLLPGTRVTGETVQATLESIGYTDPTSGQPRVPRRPLDPGSEVLGVDFDFLCNFYRFDPATSSHWRCRSISSTWTSLVRCCRG